MDQKDLPLKVKMRELFWRIGYSARINIPLRAYVRPSQNKRPNFEEYTDLDVLGIAVGRDARVESVIADCKTTGGGSTERMFWLKGVAHFFRSDTAYLVRESDPTRAARQLANRLDISIVTSSDFHTLEEFYPRDSRVQWAELEKYFTLEFAHRSSANSVGMDRRLNKLVEFCKYDFWGYENYRVLTQIGAHLREAAPALSIDNPAHISLFLDCTWLFAVSLCHALEYVRRTHIADIKESLSEYVFGGQIGLREKQLVAKQMERFGASIDNTFDYDIYPPGFALIGELIARLARRPNSVNNILRYAELVHCASILRASLNLKHVFDVLFDEMAAKLLGDIAGALVTIGRLDSRFRERALQLISGEYALRSGHATVSLPPSENKVSQLALGEEQRDAIAPELPKLVE